MNKQNLQMSEQNLQTEDTEQRVSDTESQPAGDSSTTFTQEQVNTPVGKARAQERKKYANYNEYKAAYDELLSICNISTGEGGEGEFRKIVIGDFGIRLACKEKLQDIPDTPQPPIFTSIQHWMICVRLCANRVFFDRCHFFVT